VKQTLQQWKDRYDALSLRERGLVMLGVLALTHTLWNLGPMRLLHKQQNKLLTEIQQSQKNIRDIDSRIQMISAEFAPGGESAALTRIKSLKSEIQRINQVKKDVTVGFIRPRQMVEVLKGLLNKEPGLKLVSFKSLDAEPLFANKEGDGKNVANSRAAASTPTAKPSTDGQPVMQSYPEVYKHGVVIQFQGDYQSTVEYLQSLESLPWKFYWDGMAYEVQEYPKALITINVFTLSLEKGWIGV
jgi:MSHA biogenesis protein MshJ